MLGIEPGTACMLSYGPSPSGAHLWGRSFLLGPLWSSHSAYIRVVFASGAWRDPLGLLAITFPTQAWADKAVFRSTFFTWLSWAGSAG